MTQTATRQKPVRLDEPRAAFFRRRLWCVLASGVAHIGLAAGLVFATVESVRPRGGGLPAHRCQIAYHDEPQHMAAQPYEIKRAAQPAEAAPREHAVTRELDRAEFDAPARADFIQSFNGAVRPSDELLYGTFTRSTGNAANDASAPAANDASAAGDASAAPMQTVYNNLAQTWEANGSADLPAVARTLTQPDYPSIAVRKNWEGVVTLRLTVSDTGDVTAAEIAASSGHAALDEAALETALSEWRFTPATRGGKFVASVVEQAVRFRLVN